MNQSFNLNAKILSILATALVSGSVIAGDAANSKTNIYVDLDSNPAKAHSQMQSLNTMDVLGVNLKKHWAEVLVTKEELAQLKALNLKIRKKAKRNTFAAKSDEYLTPELVVQGLKNINAQYPAITKLFEAGKTHQQRPIMGLEISAHVGDVNKPTLVFNGMHHAREVMTPEIVMNIANVLTEKYGKDTEVTSWLDNYRIVVVPQVNPDGNAIVNTTDDMWRKNAYQAGGRVVGVDINRNYPAYWNYCNGSSGNANSETYRGPSAASEPETQALMGVASTYQPVAEISYHSYSEMILYPSGCSSVKNPAKELFHSIGQEMNANIRNDENQKNAYSVGTVPELLYQADGGDIDWLWKENGVLTYVIEVNAWDFHPDYQRWRDVTIERQQGGWQTLIRRMAKSGFRAHVETSAPDKLSYSLKKIEGMKKFAFDADEPERTFKLRSSSGLLYQLTEKGKYEVTFYSNNQPVKTMTIDIGDKLVDLGNIAV